MFGSFEWFSFDLIWILFFFQSFYLMILMVFRINRINGISEKRHKCADELYLSGLEEAPLYVFVHALDSV